MARKSYKVKTRRRGGLGAVYGFICLVAVGFAVFFTISIFFKVKTIEVIGVSIVEEDAVRRASQILQGDNLFLINKAAASRSIRMEISYIDTIRIRRSLPSTVIIEVEESRPIGAIQNGIDYWLVTSTGKLLKSVSEPNLPGDVPVITGISILRPQSGQYMAVAEADSDKENPILEVLNALQDADMLSQVQLVDMSKVFDVRFTFENRLTVILGMPVNLDYKLRFFQQVIADRNPNERATIDITQAQDKTAYVMVEN